MIYITILFITAHSFSLVFLLIAWNESSGTMALVETRALFSTEDKTIILDYTMRNYLSKTFA